MSNPKGCIALMHQPSIAEERPKDGKHGDAARQTTWWSSFFFFFFFFFWVTGEMSIPLWQEALKDARRT
ncbi:hypothetical protein ABBQ38_002002 [Trebouxia sp. C0009 RCD-2024]